LPISVRRRRLRRVGVHVAAKRAAMPVACRGGKPLTASYWRANAPCSAVPVRTSRAGEMNRSSLPTESAESN
jgi:hypothetical protein